MVLLGVLFANATFGLNLDHPERDIQFEDQSNLSFTFIKLCKELECFICAIDNRNTLLAKMLKFFKEDTRYYSVPWSLHYKKLSCQYNTMAAIPPSAFSAGRIRETQRDMKVSNIKKGSESPKFFNSNLTELSPLKYNSKLMNSIWGIYNRYSPHNVKKITDASNLNSGLQQTAANSGTKNESMLSIPAANLDNVWAANYASQSH